MRRQIARVKSTAQPSSKEAPTSTSSEVREAPAREGAFDSDAFFSALDGVRIARGKNWKQLANEAGISPSTLTRMAQGKRPDVDSLAALGRWSGLTIDSFVRKGQAVAEAEPLAMISTYLRADRHLSPEAQKALEAVIKATYERLRRE